MFFPDNLSKLFPCTNDSEILKDKSITVIVWLPNNILCLHCPLSIPDEGGPASPSFIKSNKENGFLCQIFSQ